MPRHRRASRRRLAQGAPPSRRRSQPPGPLPVCLLVLAGACGGGGSGASSTTAPAAFEPGDNVLVLLADDVGVDMLASYGVGADPAHTPVLDALATDGMRFATVWANPICSPTRAALQTGLTASDSGVGWNTSVDPVFSVVGIQPDATTLPELLELGSGGAYTSAAIGKWHLGHTADVGGIDAARFHGYDHFSGPLGNISDYYDYERVVDGVAEQRLSYAVTDKVDDALAWITGVKDQPWFCYVAFNTPHGPTHDPPASLHTVDLTKTNDDDADRRRQYQAMIEALDTEIGRLLAGLGSELDATTVVFVGDNGTPGQFLIPPALDRGKGTLFEDGVLVPLIVAGPHVASPGSTSDALVQVSDLFATVAELANVDVAATLPTGTPLDSVSLVPYLEDPSTPSLRTSIRSEMFFPNGPGAGAPFPLPDLGPDVCQEDIGFGGPGTMRLELCDAHLALGNEPVLRITGAPPSSAGLVLQSYAANPTPVGAGTVVATPPFDTLVVTTDAFGQAEVHGLHLILADFRITMQAVFEDPLLLGGFSISNALEAQHLPWNRKAARNERYKVIQSVNGGPTELYDLAVDPLETVDLTESANLSTAEQAAFDELRARIEGL